MKNNYVKIGTAIVLSILTIGIAIYSVLTGKITFDEFKNATTQEAEIVDKNLNELFE